MYIFFRDRLCVRNHSECPRTTLFVPDEYCGRGPHRENHVSGGEITHRLTDSEGSPSAPKAIIQGPLAGLLEWQAMAEGAYSPNTLRAQKADGAIFQAFCEQRGEPRSPSRS